MIGASSIISFNIAGEGVVQKTSEDIVKEKLRFLLTTNKGEIPNNPGYGADLQHFIHLPMDDSLLVGLENTIRIEVALEMPYVIIKSVVVDRGITTQGILAFTLNYELAEGFEDSVQVVI